MCVCERERDREKPLKETALSAQRLDLPSSTERFYIYFFYPPVPLSLLLRNEKVVLL